jgi:hypothetical protein
MRIPYWKRVYIRKDKTIWENVYNKKRVWVKQGTNISWFFGDYEGVTIVFKDTPTKDKHINQSRNKKAAFEFAVKYMRNNPR